jgi:hypothetical protein
MTTTLWEGLPINRKVETRAGKKRKTDQRTDPEQAWQRPDQQPHAKGRFRIDRRQTPVRRRQQFQAAKSIGRGIEEFEAGRRDQEQAQNHADDGETVPPLTGKG